MPTADFRQIAFGGGPANCERLFRASISAFCMRTRPTREEVAQLDDLALGLFDSVSPDAHRFAAASLCECDPAPRRLIQRLCDQPADIAAPLLARSKALRDIDLIALIARHGASHARAIARRDGLNPAIAALIRILLAPAGPEGGNTSAADAERENTLEDVRRRLRELMHDDCDQKRRTPDPRNMYAVLRQAALSGDKESIYEALAHSTDISQERAQRLISGVTYVEFLNEVKILRLSTEQAFLITAAIFPAQFAYVGSVRRFVERYESTGPGDGKVEAAYRRGNHSQLAEFQSLASTR